MLNKYHKEDISKSKFLVTGGAGFIGSHISEYLVKFGAQKVIVLDNLSNGSKSNIEDLETYKNFEFVEGDIVNEGLCNDLVKDVHYVCHQAALGSVPRSINNPISSNEANVNGFLNIIHASHKSKSVKQFVYASSSSVYGDSKELPKIEGKEGKVLSPYALTKSINEQYANIFHQVYGFKSVGLRYFNVFGPKQNPNNPYAAVIPIFCKMILNSKKPTINGDKKISRDFTYVENVVQANILSLLQNNKGQHNIYNVACGKQIELERVIELIQKIMDKKIGFNIGPPRPGDILHSNADISKIQNELRYEPLIEFEQGLRKTIEWIKSSKQP